jgi:5-methylcytosine-specific restriction endonuclease McrA
MRKRKGVKKRARNDTSSKARKTIKRKRAQKSRVVKTRNGGTLTEAQYWQKIRHALRHAFRFWKPMMVALKKAERPYNGPNKRLKKEYQCAECKQWFPRTQVQIDHIIPCGTLNCDADVAQFIRNLTPESPDAFQILCKKDHAEKTKKEKDERTNINNLQVLRQKGA